MEHIKDPIERIVAEALTAAGIRFSIPHEGADFFLPDHNIYIECKQFYSERIAKQMAGLSDVIVIQGKQAALTFAQMLNGKRSVDR